MLELTEVLRGGRQCDEDGVEIIMSREACHVAADEIERLRLENGRLKDQSEALARTVMGDIGNQREPLTTAQINDLVGEVYTNCGHMQPTPEIIVRAIERAHGIGNLPELPTCTKSQTPIDWSRVERAEALGVAVHVTPAINEECRHDWENGEDGNPERCGKCGLSFMRYVHSCCP